MDAESEPIRIGLAGCGRVALSIHLKVLASLPGVRVAAIAEADDERRRAARTLVPGAAAFADYREVFARPDVDAVVIALPTGLHAASAVAAFEAGKHVFLEKPLATRLDDGRAVLAAWRASGRTGMIGFNYRFNRLHVELKRFLEARRLGRPVAVRSIFSSARRELETWKRERASGGGVLLDLASHHVDLARFHFGTDIEEVTCLLQSVESEDDTAAVQLRLGGGLLMQSFFSHSAADEDRFAVYCERGSVKADRRYGLSLELSTGIDRRHRLDQGRHVWRSLRGAGYGFEKFRAIGHEPSYGRVLAHFVGALRGRHPATPDLEDGYRSLEVVIAAEESARTARSVGVGVPTAGAGPR
ncbi:MAG TPA: Gfo/Idh/MocA family oxidoreductase [Gemmatimonadota bacterium]